MTPHLEDKVKDLLCAALQEVGLEIAPADLIPELSLQADLGCDSFQLMRVSRTLEEAFDLTFTLVDWYLYESERTQGPAFTVGSLMAYVTSQVNPSPEVSDAGA